MRRRVTGMRLPRETRAPRTPGELRAHVAMVVSLGTASLTMLFGGAWLFAVLLLVILVCWLAGDLHR